jgi:hypothetical protein
MSPMGGLLGWPAAPRPFDPLRAGAELARTALAAAAAKTAGAFPGQNAGSFTPAAEPGVSPRTSPPDPDRALKRALFAQEMLDTHRKSFADAREMRRLAVETGETWAIQSQSNQRSRIDHPGGVEAYIAELDKRLANADEILGGMQQNAEKAWKAVSGGGADERVDVRV